MRIQAGRLALLFATALVLSAGFLSPADEKAPAPHNREAAAPHATGLVFEDPESDPAAVRGERIFKVLGEIPEVQQTAASHFNLDYLPPVASQGGQGSCVAWAVGYYLKSFQENRENGRSDSGLRGLPENICSPAFIYNLIHIAEDGGAYFSDAFRVLNDFGCASWQDMPYTDQDYQTWPDENDFEDAAARRTQPPEGFEYAYLKVNSDSTLATVKQMLASGRLLIFGIYVYGNYDNIASFDDIYAVAQKYGLSRGGHAQTLVGYDDAKVTPDGVGAFRAVNSWGTSWGDEGFYWITYQAIRYGSGLSQGYVYWIDDRTAYQPQKKAAFRINHAYSRETTTRIQAGGMQIPFLDFSANYRKRDYRGFPASRILLDLTDLESVLLPGAEIRLYLADEISNGVEGSIQEFLYRDGETGMESVSTQTPVTVIDLYEEFAGLTILAPDQPVIHLDPVSLEFAALEGGEAPPSRAFAVSNAGTGEMSWTAAGDVSWLECAPSAGNQSESIAVSVNSSFLPPGTHSGNVLVSSPEAANSPRSVSVSVQVYVPGADGAPFGQFDTPLEESEVYGSIPVTGWALDDIGVERVVISRDPVTGEGTSPVYIGDAVFVEGARPDVEVTYPHYPGASRAGWGYMLLTHFLPGEGNGTVVLRAAAEDASGHQTQLGTRTIHCDNAGSVLPFGAIDTPAQGGTASGPNYIQFGWALTPLPNAIPQTGATINVYVDGVNLGHPVYNQYREDIATLFPGYLNSQGAVGYFVLDTTAYAGGVHTIQWTAQDDAGNIEGIGSRYFQIENPASTWAAAAPSADRTDRINSVPGTTLRTKPLTLPGPAGRRPAPLSRYPDTRGVFRVEIRETGLLEIQFGKGGSLSGNLRVGGSLRKLPAGSTLRGRTFSWGPGPGCLGEYHLEFAGENSDGTRERIPVIIFIQPKSTRLR